MERSKASDTRGSDQLRLGLRAATAAGDIIRAAFGTTQTIKSKGINDIVTETDKKAEDAIVKILQEESSYKILTEESGDIDGSSDGCWVIDPLDGTGNFSRGFPLFSVSIALVKNDALQIGVVFNPITNELFWAEKGAGAYKNGEPIHVSGKSKTAILALDCGYAPEHGAAYAQATGILEQDYLLRRIGGCALEVCYVACGIFDGYVDYGDMLWDYAGGLCIVEEAGGKVTDWKGNPLKLDHEQHVLATNGTIHHSLIQKLSHLQE